MVSSGVRVAILSFIIVAASLAFVIYFNQRPLDGPVTSEIEQVVPLINSNDGTHINTTIAFSVLIENTGRIQNTVIECRDIQSHLLLVDQTQPLELYSQGDFSPTTSYYLSDEFIAPTCVEESSNQRISEGTVDELIVSISFMLINGNYSFVWFHSFADEFIGAELSVDVAADSIDIKYSNYTLVDLPA